MLAGAALNGANLYSALLLLVFAAGASTSLALALLAGGKTLKVMKRGLGAEKWVRQLLGIAVVAGVIAIVFGWDTRVLSKVTLLNTTGTEEKLIEKLSIKPSTATSENGTAALASLKGATLWLNSPPLDVGTLRGKVVLVDFWTYSCINCLRTLPYLNAWDKKYRSEGLVIIGVHSPEFAFEKEKHNVEVAIHDLGVTYPVTMDNEYAIWNAFNNNVWPAHYLIDATGRIRDKHFGEGAYEDTERKIQTLLKEAHNGAPVTGDSLVHVRGTGATAAASGKYLSPETYIGYARQENLVSPETVMHDVAAQYTAPVSFEPDQWALSGRWMVTEEAALLQAVGGSITYRFQGRDLHLVLGAGNGKPVRFRVTLDGVAPGADHGSDIDKDGNGVIRGQRLYQLIRLRGRIGLHIFRIEFFDAGAEAFAFTFG